MIAIHKVHRQLAVITAMNLNNRGELDISRLELEFMKPLLMKNLELVARLDELKQLSQLAYEKNEVDWHHDLCKQIEELEAQLI
ncbi:DUF7667 family protein [Paenibacillus wynnii]|uniref:Uncharacterized protein n=1 Tax=Paenibacillus wynnii TaxID=268407 RepID=A0A098MDN2_9BACL|nr:hypothetical protein [Paenibacillus wynnii]KGE20675.1 hypothetical protein PWYN_00285 [Paenibacillus wynnii]